MFSVVGGAAFFYVAGTFLARYMYTSDPKTAAVLVLLLAALPAALYFCIRLIYARKLPILLTPVFALAGIFILGTASDVSLHTAYDAVGRECELTGVVITVPREFDGTFQFVLKTDSIIYEETQLKTSEKIKVTSAAKPKSGSEIKIKGELKEIDAPKNSSSFDSKSYYARQGIFFRIYTESAELINENGANPLTAFSLLVNEKAQTFAETAFPSSVSPLLLGIALNNKSQIPEQQRNIFMISGTYRYIYCPYLHTALLLFIISLLIESRKKLIVAYLLVFPLYLLLNTSLASAWRICLFVCLSIFLASRLHRSNGRNVLYLTILLTGIFSPFTLYSEGFILSCFAAIMIRSFHKPLFNLMLHVFRRGYLSHFVTIFFISSFTLAPLAAYMNMSYTAYSLVAGIIVMPLVAAVYIMYWISFFIYAVFGKAFVFLITPALNAVNFISSAISSLPFATIYLQRPSGYFVALFLILLYYAYAAVKRYRFRNAVLVLAAVFFLIFSAGEIKKVGSADLVFLSVGQGDCAIIHLPGGKTAMIDGGGSPVYSDISIGETEVLPYLRSRGVSEIDYMFISHYHKDHCDGLVTVLQNMRVKQIFMPEYLSNGDYRDIIENEAERQGTAVTPVSRPVNMRLSDSLECEFIYGDAQKNAADENDRSLVFRLTINGVRVLFTGDISKFTENDLNNIDSDILKVPHHGSKTSTGSALLKKVTPEYCVACLGEDNPYGFPSSQVVDTIAKSGAALLRTDESGELHFILKNGCIEKIYSFRQGRIHG